MAVFRVNKTRDFTIMSNYHLRDRELSCKACGLLSKMLSLPDEWDYTTRGLAAICKDGVAAIGSALKELELRGYLVRHRLRDERGVLTDIEYIIYEKPHLPSQDIDAPSPGAPRLENPHTENRYMDNPDMEKPRMENRAQSNTLQEKKKKSKTDLSRTDSFIPSEPVCNGAQPGLTAPPAKSKDGMNEGVAVRESIKKQIEYDNMVTRYPRVQLDELVELMTEVAMNRSPMTKIGRDQSYTTGFVQDRFRQITAGHIEKVLEGIAENTTRVMNTRAYLLSALFNSVSTIDHHYTMLDNYDQHCF